MGVFKKMRNSLLKKLTLSIVLGLVMGQANACTTILAGQGATANNSYIVSRTSDGYINEVKYLAYHPHMENQTGILKFKGNDFTWKIPKVSLAYSCVPDYGADDFGSCGFNELGVGVTATETIYPSDKVLAVDPFVVKTGINEHSLTDVLLCQSHSAKDGVALLGKIVETQGAAEGFGVAFVDKDGIWYFETASGHHWLAAKIPQDSCFVTANQGRFREYDSDDKENYMASPGLMEFAVQNGFYNPKKGKFDFHSVFMRNNKTDVVYNHSRVQRLTEIVTGNKLKPVYKDGDRMPVYLQPARKLTLDDIKAMHRDQYEGTKFDPYNRMDPRTPGRPISVFRQEVCHVLEVRPDLPKEIGMVNYVALGMANLGLYLPLYQGLHEYLPEYGYQETDVSNYNSKVACWRYRQLQTLVMQDYPRYAPMVKKAYGDLEKDFALRQQKMEAEYLKIYKDNPSAAANLLKDFEMQVMRDGLDLTDKLTAEIIGAMTRRVDDVYHYSASKPNNTAGYMHPDA